MKKINIRRLYYLFRHKYCTLNNIVVTVGLVISIGWVWGSLEVMDRNYKLQKELDDKSRQLIVAQLDMENEKLQQRYYKTFEYQELAVRQRLNLVSPGESVLILPENSAEAKAVDEVSSGDNENDVPISNFNQWMNFLFGGNSKRISS